MRRAYRLTDHARQEMERRGISEVMVDRIMSEPQQVVQTYGDRQAYQSQAEIGGKLYVVRVIVEEGDPLTVITVYRSSKIAKYWGDSHEGDL